MNRAVIELACLLAVSLSATAGDVYVTKDANGNIVYTDTPQTVPAQKVGVASTPADDAASAERAQAAAKQYENQDQATGKALAKQATSQQAAQLSAEDLAKRCADARQTYAKYMQSWKLYENGPNGERIYLTSDQIDAARLNAKQVMDQFCGDQPAQ